MNEVAIIGLGIGDVHNRIANELGLQTITVDTDPLKNPTYTSVDDLIKNHKSLGAIIIATPNFTHGPLIKKLTYYTGLILVEKPGLKSSEDWQEMLSFCQYYGTKLIMTKNNMFRNEISDWQQKYNQSSLINIIWANKNRIPFPGGWFTNKELAFGGIEYDLLPHLIHIFLAINTKKLVDPIFGTAYQQWSLGRVKDTEYGTCKIDGVFDVHDHCRLEFESDNRKINCLAIWKTDEISENLIEIQFLSNSVERVPLGLCPEEAYKNQLDYFLKLDKSEYKNQQEIDLFVLRCIEKIPYNEGDFWRDISK